MTVNYALPQFARVSSVFQILYMKMQCNVQCNTELVQGFPSNFFLIQCTHKVTFISMSCHISSCSGHIFIFYIFEFQNEFPIKISFPSIPHHSQLERVLAICSYQGILSRRHVNNTMKVPANKHEDISIYLQSSTYLRSAFKKTCLLYLLRHCFGERYIRDTLLTMSATMSQFGVWPGERIIKFKGSSRSTCTA